MRSRNTPRASTRLVAIRADPFGGLTKQKGGSMGNDGGSHIETGTDGLSAQVIKPSLREISTIGYQAMPHASYQQLVIKFCLAQDINNWLSSYISRKLSTIGYQAMPHASYQQLSYQAKPPAPGRPQTRSTMSGPQY